MIRHATGVDGNRTAPESREETGEDGDTDAHSDARSGARLATREMDETELGSIVAAWPDLPSPIRRAMLALSEAVAPD